MRILWHSNSPWSPSGYGQQTAMFLPRLRALGHEVACLANYGVQGAAFEWDGYPVFPSAGTKDNDAILAWHEIYEPDLVISLFDAWTLKPRKWPQVRLASWAPVDHFPLPVAVYSTLREANVRPIAMSRFGEHWMRHRKLDPLYVPHGVDTRLFRPQPEIRAAVRAEMGIPADAFVVGMVAANSAYGEFPRKGYGQALQAFARFLERHQDAWMYCHTRVVGALNLENLLTAIADVAGKPKPLLDRVKFPPDSIWYRGFATEEVANLYNAFDVLLNPSMGEGFGIPIIEAQACGVPVIASDHSAMTELTQAGWLVQGDPWWDEAQTSFGFSPSIGSIVAALEAAYESRDDQALRTAAAIFGATFDADLVTETYWEPVLEQLARPREVPPLAVNGNRAQRRAAKKQKATTGGAR